MEQRIADRTKWAVGILGVAVLLLAGAVQAAQVEGDHEIQVSAGFFHAEGSESGNMNVDVSYGKFITDRWELGIRQTLAYSFIDNADDEWTASTTPFASYHFRGISAYDRFQPFVGAFVGAAYTEGDGTATIGPHLGFKYFVDDQTFVVTRYRYEWFPDDLTVNDITDERADGNHVVTVGLGYVWGGVGKR